MTMLDQRLPSPRDILAGSAPPPPTSSHQPYPPINPLQTSPLPSIETHQPNTHTVYTFPPAENRYQSIHNFRSYAMESTGSRDSIREMSRSSSPEPHSSNIQSPGSYRFPSRAPSPKRRVSIQYGDSGSTASLSSGIRDMSMSVAAQTPSPPIPSENEYRSLSPLDVPVHRHIPTFNPDRRRGSITDPLLHHQPSSGRRFSLADTAHPYPMPPGRRGSLAAIQSSTAEHDSRPASPSVSHRPSPLDHRSDRLSERRESLPRLTLPPGVSGDIFQRRHSIAVTAPPTSYSSNSTSAPVPPFDRKEHFIPSITTYPERRNSYSAPVSPPADSPNSSNGSTPRVSTEENEYQFPGKPNLPNISEIHESISSSPIDPEYRFPSQHTTTPRPGRRSSVIHMPGNASPNMGRRASMPMVAYTRPTPPTSTDPAAYRDPMLSPGAGIGPSPMELDKYRTSSSSGSAPMHAPPSSVSSYYSPPPPGHPHYLYPAMQTGPPSAGSPSTPNAEKDTPYSRSPELRVSHKLAERKRRKEMKELFDELRDALPVEKSMKTSKWEILSKAVEYISTLKHHETDLEREVDALRREIAMLKTGSSS